MNGFLYAIGAGDHVKIGWSSDPLRRLAKIKSDCPTDAQLLGVISASREQEAEAHRLLAPWRVRREWFSRNAVVEQFISMLPKPAPYPARYEVCPTDHPLVAWRKERRLTQHDLAKLIGSTHASVSRWEAGLREPRGNQRRALVQATGLPAESFLLQAAS